MLNRNNRIVYFLSQVTQIDLSTEKQQHNLFVWLNHFILTVQILIKLFYI